MDAESTGAAANDGADRLSAPDKPPRSGGMDYGSCADFIWRCVPTKETFWRVRSMRAPPSPAAGIEHWSCSISNCRRGWRPPARAFQAVSPIGPPLPLNHSTRDLVAGKVRLAAKVCYFRTGELLLRSRAGSMKRSPYHFFVRPSPRPFPFAHPPTLLLFHSAA